jgi:glycerol-3-phosphate cytidylyltransferase
VKRVITYGSFDLLHYGHISLLRRAKAMGQYLVVGLSTESFCALKGKQCYFSYEEREQLLEAVRFVDLVIPETCWEQKVEDVRSYHIDVFVIGEDWKGEFDFLGDLCEVVYLPRTPEISTTQIKSHVDLRGSRSARQRQNGTIAPTGQHAESAGFEAGTTSEGS